MCGLNGIECFFLLVFQVLRRLERWEWVKGVEETERRRKMGNHVFALKVMG
jgi:hypothetical protein